MHAYVFCSFRTTSKFFNLLTCKQDFLCCVKLCGGGQGGREPGRIGAGGGREARGDGAGCGSYVRAGSGRRMRDIKLFNDFLVPF